MPKIQVIIIAHDKIRVGSIWGTLHKDIEDDLYYLEGEDSYLYFHEHQIVYKNYNLWTVNLSIKE